MEARGEPDLRHPLDSQLIMTTERTYGSKRYSNVCYCKRPCRYQMVQRSPGYVLVSSLLALQLAFTIAVALLSLSFGSRLFLVFQERPDLIRELIIFQFVSIGC